METRNVIKFLGTKIPFINKGGCLLAAYAFYLHEKKYGRADDLQIVQLSLHPNLLKQNKEFILNGNGTAASDAHFGWTYDGGWNVRDCKNEVDPESYIEWWLIPKEKTDEFCISALNFGRWNPLFNRERAQKRISEALDIDLSAVYDKRQQTIDGTVFTD